MKKLKIPDIIYYFTDSSLIAKTLDGSHKSHCKQGNTTRTLAGAFKHIRTMPTYAGLGDYVILAACISWMRNNNQSFTLKEIRRCFNYFEDYDSRNVAFYKDLVEQLAASGDPLFSKNKRIVRANADGND